MWTTINWKFSPAAEGFAVHRRTLAVLNLPRKIHIPYKFKLVFLFIFFISFSNLFKSFIIFHQSLFSCLYCRRYSLVSLPSNYMGMVSLFFFTYLVFSSFIIFHFCFNFSCTLYFYFIHTILVTSFTHFVGFLFCHASHAVSH